MLRSRNGKGVARCTATPTPPVRVDSPDTRVQVGTAAARIRAGRFAGTLGKMSRTFIAEIPMLEEAGPALKFADTALRSAAGIK